MPSPDSLPSNILIDACLIGTDFVPFLIFLSWWRMKFLMTFTVCGYLLDTLNEVETVYSLISIIWQLNLLSANI